MSVTSRLLGDPAERRAYIRSAAAALGHAPAVVEKDFWICVVLQTLARAPGPRWVFKGGTSLSKVYRLIDRFSEDVDLTLVRDSEPALPDPQEAGLSSRARARRVDAWVAWGARTVREVVVPAVSAGLNDAGCGEPVDIVGDGDVWRVVYPACVEADTTAYVAPSVQLEFGCRGAVEPAATHRIGTAITQATGDDSVDVVVDVPVLAVERTFFEKLTAVHGFWHRAHPQEDRVPRLPSARLARHWYDLHAMWRHPATRARVLANRDLLGEVVDHKRVWFRDPGARLEEARHTPRVVPSGALREPVSSDYAAMRSMFPAVPGPPPWGAVVASCEEIERVFSRTG